MSITKCHFSLVTTPPEKLDYLQRIPHVDSPFTNELAFIHYLFKADLGGTAFYRHRATDTSTSMERKPEYLRVVEEEKLGPTARRPDTSTGIHRFTSRLAGRTAYSTDAGLSPQFAAFGRLARISSRTSIPAPAGCR